MKPQISLRKALADKLLLGRSLSGDSRAAWKVLLIAAAGEQLNDDERKIFQKLTGREREPGQRVAELEVVAGRRGGKSRAISVLITYLAGLCDHKDVLVPGERGVLLCIALDQRVAKIILDYCQATFEASPILRQLVRGRSSDTLELSNGVSIEVRPASFRKLRGPTYIGVVCDELAFWYVEDQYANPDTEIINAVRPGLLTTRGPLILASSPYARRGVLWETFRKHYGPTGAPTVLVAQGTTRDFNPTVPQAEIDRALEEDLPRNSAEYLAQFRSDLEAFVSIEAVRACVNNNTFERAPAPGISYAAFVDPAGGSGADSMTLAVGHIDYSTHVVIIDAVRERRPPFSPEAVTSDFADLLRSYNISKIIGDRFAGGYPPEQFGKFNILYEQSAKPRSDLYCDLLPLINSCRIALLDDPRLVSQLCSLERRSGRGGRDTIDHPPNGHDDLANAVAGLASINTLFPAYDNSYAGWGEDTDQDRSAAAARYQRQRLAGYIFNLSGNTIWPG